MVIGNPAKWLPALFQGVAASGHLGGWVGGWIVQISNKSEVELWKLEFHSLRLVREVWHGGDLWHSDQTLLFPEDVGNQLDLILSSNILLLCIW
jgi:hypothetical protein